MAELNRRDFLKVLGISGTASACSIDPVTPIENVLPYVVTPDQIVPGVATWFATQCTACPVGCGVLAKNREGRIVMLEGNPEHPTNTGSLCAKGTTDLQATYSPDRFAGPMVAGKASSWDDAMAAAAGAIKSAQAGGKKIAWLGRERTGATAAVSNMVMAAMGANVVRWEPLGKEALRKATKAVFGINGVPTYTLDQAETIVSFGADFLSTWGGPDLQKGYGDSRDPDHCGFMSQFWTVEPRLSNTSVNADVHLSAAPGTEAGVALALAKMVAAKKGYTGPALALLSAIDAEGLIAAAGIRMERITELVDRLSENLSIIMPNGTSTVNGEAVATASLILNEVAGNIGETVTFGQDANLDGIGFYSDVESLLADAENIGVLFLDELDVVYTTPGSAAKDALAKVGQIIAFQNEPSESLNAAAIVLPPGTTLENWGDNESIQGRHTLQQPAMKSIKDTRGTGDVLLGLSATLGLSGGDEESAALPDNFLSFLQGWWKENVFVKTGDSDWDGFWRSTVQNGGHFFSTLGKGATFQLGTAPDAGAANGGVTLSLFPHHITYDGRHANRPWAHEIPEPVSGFVWGTWAEISVATAKQLGLAEDDMVKLTTEAGSVEVAFFTSPGIRDDMVSVVMGNGHEGAGRYADLTGANPVNLLTSMNYAGDKVTVTKAGKTKSISTQLGNLTQDNRPINYVVKAKDIGSGKGPGGIVHLHHPPIDERLTQAGLLDMYPEPEHPTYRFAMSLDLNKCTGCGACQAACYAENNVGVVGPEQARRGRHMGWIRLSRYWEGSGETPDVRWQPTMCQQCSHAPCEGVCPVLATYHNLDGLNAMVYNRCVGTRYCANNCPYSARRFNYHTYDWPEPFHMMLNPDVSTRTMGVMEKCTFCVQRIRDTKSDYRDEGQVVPDSALTGLTACASACGAKAITFGNAKDPNSVVAKKFDSERAYAMLSELNTKPGVRYLARISHSEAETGHGGGH
jgi:Fe-S-cluster-containing dehydrogenase component/anaerobic selenocysteine-containing dehydrogenase